MALAAPTVTATVRAARFAACAFALVVTPVATVTVHSDPAASVGVPDAAVRVSVAVAVAEPDTADVNVVLPHPLDVLGTAGEAMVNVGSTKAMLSAAARGVFTSNVYEMDDADHVAASAIASTLVARAGATVAVDFVTFTAAISATFASLSVTAAVRPLQSEGCAFVLVVTPVAIVTVHS